MTNKQSFFWSSLPPKIEDVMTQEIYQELQRLAFRAKLKAQRDENIRAIKIIGQELCEDQAKGPLHLTYKADNEGKK